MTTYTQPRFEPCAMPYCTECDLRQGIDTEHFPDGECPYSDPRSFPTSCSHHHQYVRDDRLIWDMAKAVGIHGDESVAVDTVDLLAGNCQYFDEELFWEWAARWADFDPVEEDLKNTESEFKTRKIARLESELRRIRGIPDDDGAA